MNSTLVMDQVAADLLVPLFSNVGTALAISLSCFGSAIALAQYTKQQPESTSSSDIECPPGKPRYTELPSVSTPLSPQASYPLSHNRLSFILLASIPALYGLIIAILIHQHSSSISHPPSLSQAIQYLSAGLTIGLSCLAAGLGLRNIDPSDGKNFRTNFLSAIFCESIGLYGLIVALILSN